MLRRGLRLVETGETAIVTLVEAPVLGHRQPQPPHRFEREVQCLDRPRLDRGEAGVGRDTLCLHQLARRPGLRRALFGDVDVPPAGEAVFEVPLRLAVTDEDELRLSRSLLVGRDRKSTRLNSCHYCAT